MIHVHGASLGGRVRWCRASLGAAGLVRAFSATRRRGSSSGIVRRSFREVGDHVNAGDPLFEILPDPTPLELTEARREVEIARNVYDQAKKRSDRTAVLGRSSTWQPPRR